MIFTWLMFSVRKMSICSRFCKLYRVSGKKHVKIASKYVHVSQHKTHSRVFYLKFKKFWEKIRTVMQNDVLVICSLYCTVHVEGSTDWHNILTASCVCVKVNEWGKGREEELMNELINGRAFMWRWTGTYLPITQNTLPTNYLITI